MKIQNIPILLLLLFNFACNQPIVNKTINDKDANIKLYHYSYISSQSPDFLEITKNDSTVVILKSGFGVMDVRLENDTIIITHVKFQKPNEIQLTKPVFGYIIKYEEKECFDLYTGDDDDNFKQKTE